MEYTYKGGKNLDPFELQARINKAVEERKRKDSIGIARYFHEEGWTEEQILPLIMNSINIPRAKAQGYYQEALGETE